MGPNKRSFRYIGDNMEDKPTVEEKVLTREEVVAAKTDKAKALIKQFKTKGVTFTIEPSADDSYSVFVSASRVDNEGFQRETRIDIANDDSDEESFTKALEQMADREAPVVPPIKTFEEV